MLVILQGGAGNADGSEDLGNHLAGRFTVVTYDRRGLSRSAPFTPEGHEVAAHSADVASLIAAFTAEPVLVFGASIGALIGLDLATRHPNRIRALVAHEPPAFRLLDPEALEDALRRHSEVLQAFEQHGVAAGMKLMLAMTGMDMNDREPDVPISALAVVARPLWLGFAGHPRLNFRADIPATCFDPGPSRPNLRKSLGPFPNCK